MHTPAPVATMNSTADPVLQARRLLRGSHSAALATLSQRLAGYPYASAVPFIVDSQSNPVTLISRLAEHTKNLATDDRASLLVHGSGADVQASARLTIVGHCRRIDDTDAIARRYLRYFPDAVDLIALDFDFFRLTSSAIRYIGGFGTIHWLGGDALAPAPHAIEQIEHEAIARMNSEHAQALRTYCKRLHGVAPHEGAVIGLDCDGIDVRADGNIFRADFPAPAYDAASMQAALARLVQEWRG